VTSADDPGASAADEASTGSKWATVPEGLIAIVLMAIGGLGLLSSPMALLFTEGVPTDFLGGPTGYFIIASLLSMSCLVAGFAISRSREWGRVLGIVILLVFAALFFPSVWVVVPLAAALVLVWRWRPT
jgi:hypothetical protein